MNLRQFARGKWCTMRIPGICINDPETVVLCHVRTIGTGMGRKPNDLTAFWGCSACHDEYDRRTTHLPDPTVLEGYALDAMARTHDEYERAGIKVSIPK